MAADVGAGLTAWTAWEPRKSDDKMKCRVPQIIVPRIPAAIAVVGGDGSFLSNRPNTRSCGSRGF